MMVSNGKVIINKLSKEEVDEIIDMVSEEDFIKLQIFEEVIWRKISMSKYYKNCDLTRAYWNPKEKVFFLGFEGIKYCSKYFAKDIPLSLLPKNWKVVIRNVWDDKCAYEYVTGRKIDFESEEYQKLEGTIISGFGWCIHKNKSLIELIKKSNKMVDKLLK